MNTFGAYELHITLPMIRPRVWLRIVVPDDIRLCRLHHVIQAITGARDTGQYFFIDGRRTVFADPVLIHHSHVKAGSDVELRDVLGISENRLRYFSGDDDSWEHAIELLNVVQTARRPNRATFVAGNRRISGRFAGRKGPLDLPGVNRTLRSIRV